VRHGLKKTDEEDFKYLRFDWIGLAYTPIEKASRLEEVQKDEMTPSRQSTIGKTAKCDSSMGYCAHPGLFL